MLSNIKFFLLVAACTLVIFIKVLRAPITTIDDQHVAVQDSSSLKFFVIGDWGSELTDEVMFSNQKRVAAAMKRRALQEGKPEFVISVGDQAYYNGVTNLTDATERFVGGFDNMYDKSLLQEQWYLTVGNHDCMGNVSALYEFADAHPKWTMKPFYKLNQELTDKSQKLSIFVLDMCTFVCASSLQENFRCDGLWRDTEMRRQEMIHWLDQELASANCSEEWCIVAGHWPIFSFGGNGPTSILIQELLPLLHKHNVAIYFSGHDHNMQHITMPSNKTTEFFVTGTGGFKLHPTLKEEIAEEAEVLNRQVQSEYFVAEYGFMAVRVTRRVIYIDFIHENGRILYSYRVTK